MPTEKTILNPKTGRTIIVGGPTYAVLVREGEIKCKDRAFRKPKEPKAPKEPRKKKEAKAPSTSGRKAVKKIKVTGGDVVATLDSADAMIASDPKLKKLVDDMEKDIDDTFNALEKKEQARDFSTVKVGDKVYYEEYKSEGGQGGKIYGEVTEVDKTDKKIKSPFFWVTIKIIKRNKTLLRSTDTNKVGDTFKTFILDSIKIASTLDKFGEVAGNDNEEWVDWVGKNNEKPKKEEPKAKTKQEKMEEEAKAAFKAPFKADGTWRMFIRDAVRFLDYIPNKLGRSELRKEEEEQEIVTAEFQTFYESPGYTYGVRWKLDEGKHLFSNGKGTGYTRVNTSSAFALASYGWEGDDEEDY